MPRRKGNVIKYKKAPGAPRRFKSAYMFFSEKKHKEIREQSSDDTKLLTTHVAKQVSEAWKDLADDERQVFHRMAETDRERYEREKAEYKGPWKVPSSKNPTAPRRPASSFLAFSNKRRREIAQQNPDMSSAQVSQFLSKLWKEAPSDVRAIFQEDERVRREQYKEELAEWTEKNTPDGRQGDTMDDQPETGAFSFRNEESDATTYPPISTLPFSTAASSTATIGAPSTSVASSTSQQLLQNLVGLPLTRPYSDILPIFYQGLGGATIQQVDHFASPYQVQQAALGHMLNMTQPNLSLSPPPSSLATFANFASSRAVATAPQTSVARNMNDPYLVGAMTQTSARRAYGSPSQQNQEHEQQEVEVSKKPASKRRGAGRAKRKDDKA